MKQSGCTTERLPVVEGVGAFCFTRGIPLEIVLMHFQRYNMVVDWVDYITAALSDGHNPRTILARIESATADIHGKKYATQVMERAVKVVAILARNRV